MPRPSHHAFGFLAFGDVANRRLQTGDPVRGRVQAARADGADEGVRAPGRESPGDLTADAGRAGRHENTLVGRGAHSCFE